MDPLGTYEILGPLNISLGPDITSYEAQNHLGETFTLHSITTNTPNELLKRLKTRSVLQNPNLVRFLDFYEDVNSKCVHLITENIKNDNLAAFLEMCFQKSKYLREDFICKILYQILCTIKTINGFYEDINANCICMMGEVFQVKLFYFSVNSNKKKVKMSQLASLLYIMCTLEPFDKRIQNLKPLESYYSSAFINLVQTILKDRSSLSKSIDKILCNATLLLKSSQWRRDNIYIKMQCTKEESEKILEQIKSREMTLKLKEELLREKEQELLRREKKVLLLEKLAKEKLALAEELIGNSKGKENEDYDADCGDSGIIMMRKPKSFVRSKSERRVKFKGHSPLKEMNFNRRKSARKSGDERMGKSTKKLFEPAEDNTVVFQDVALEKNEEELKYPTISWNEDSKRHAFDLLRIMNSGIEPRNYANAEVKHTFL